MIQIYKKKNNHNLKKARKNDKIAQTLMRVKQDFPEEEIQFNHLFTDNIL